MVQMYYILEIMFTVIYGWDKMSYCYFYLFIYLFIY